MKNLRLSVYVNLILATIFSVLCVSWHADVSLLALPVALLFTALLAFVTLVRLLARNAAREIPLVRRFFQYEPFVLITAFVLRHAGEHDVPFALDLASCILWVAVTVLSFVVLFFLSEKRVYLYSGEWAAYADSRPAQSRTGLRRVGVEVLEWVDALVQAVFTIVLLNIFIFQLYEIPSESMVPTFLISDRVAVLKTLAGPRFPLSRVGLPYVQSYDRGDIVVFRNPHYKNDRKNEVKTFLSQFVYMLTLTLVKTNVDENGQIKADPLVKRITALPGEQVMLMDGTLYVRTKDSSEFRPVEADASWAAWNLRALPSATRQKVEHFILTEEQYDNTLFIEEERRNLDLATAAIECEALAREFARYCTGGTTDGNVPVLMRSEDLYEFNLFAYANDSTVKLLSAAGGSQWFDAFLNGWHRSLEGLSGYTEKNGASGSQLIGGDLYTDSRFRLNVMAKLVFGRIVVRNAQLLQNGISASDWAGDTIRAAAFEKARMLHDYLYFMDQRNMGIFPANAADGSPRYIPENCYFMMGDNRYNSLDMRHSYERRLEPLTDYDAYSVTYETNLEPQYVSRSAIQGKASLRIWPLSRFGSPDKGLHR